MSFRTAAISWLALLLIGSALYAGDKKTVRVERIGDVPATDIFLAPSLVTADTCFVSDNQEITTRIDGWVIGFELYKSLMNPANNCINPYPFTITAINMPMIFDAATPITVAVDVEAVDSTTIPGCPIPGILLAVSSEWQATVPEAGFFNIWVPLDSPLVVNGPFFAGFYIGNAIVAAVVTDSFPVPCATYNIWDESIGWVDLVNNEYYNFPGRLIMETAGIPGGSSSATPQAELLTPAEGDVLYGQQELWAWDNAITNQAEYIMFEYSNGGPFVEIGRDFDGTSPLRDGVHPIISGTGFSINWDFSALPEGYYDVRATLVDTLGESDSTTVNVYLEPTPPTAAVISPANGSAFCAPADIDMTCTDENLSFVEIQHQEATKFFSIGATPFSQSDVGDEYSDYYSAPVAAAIATRVWFDRGYTALFQQGSTVMTTEEVIEEFATAFLTRQTLGTYDEAMFAGLQTYSGTHGGGFEFEHRRNPDYSSLRIWVEDEERVVMLGIGGSPGLWVTVHGFAAWRRLDSTYLVNVANPLSGDIESVPWRDYPGYSEINLVGTWHRVDLMISMLATDWSVTRSMVGVDFNGQDGWSIHWTPSGMIDGTHHYLRSIGHDYDNHLGPSAVLVEHNCTLVYVPGDYNNDRSTTIADLFQLIDFIVQQGAPPEGGAGRADCNCDHIVNVADIIYYMNYLYGTASPPCQ